MEPVEELTDQILVDSINQDDTVIMVYENSNCNYVFPKNKLFSTLTNLSLIENINHICWEVYGYKAGFAFIFQGTNITLELKTKKIIFDNEYYIIFTSENSSEIIPESVYIYGGHRVLNIYHINTNLAEKLIMLSTCSICMISKNCNIDFDDPFRIIVLPCGHTYHTYCIQRNINKFCPECRKEYITYENLYL